MHLLVAPFPEYFFDSSVSHPGNPQQTRPSPQGSVPVAFVPHAKAGGVVHAETVPDVLDPLDVPEVPELLDAPGLQFFGPNEPL